MFIYIHIFFLTNSLEIFLNRIFVSSWLLGPNMLSNWIKFQKSSLKLHVWCNSSFVWMFLIWLTKKLMLVLSSDKLYGVCLEFYPESPKMQTFSQRVKIIIVCLWWSLLPKFPQSSQLNSRKNFSNADLLNQKWLKTLIFNVNIFYWCKLL